LPWGDEPESVALTPDNQWAYVANAGAGTVTIIQISDPAWGTFTANVVGTLTTGAEPWNIVNSPDGTRMFVANSAQDTITVINTVTRTIIGHVDLRNSIANDPDRSRSFQPRGLAVTLDNTKLYVTRFLSYTKAGGRQGDDLGREGLVAVLNINTASANIADYNVARTIALAPRVTGFKFPGLTNPPAPDTLAFPNQLQSIVIRGGPRLFAQHRRVAHRSPALQSRYARLPQCHRRSVGSHPHRSHRDQSSPRRARARAKQAQDLLRQPVGDRLYHRRWIRSGLRGFRRQRCTRETERRCQRQPGLHHGRQHHALHRPE
jgi:YVTN family beta-propeller protein